MNRTFTGIRRGTGFKAACRHQPYSPKGCSVGFEPTSCLVHSQVLCLLSYKHHIAEIPGVEPGHPLGWSQFSKLAHYHSVKTP